MTTTPQTPGPSPAHDAVTRCTSSSEPARSALPSLGSWSRPALGCALSPGPARDPSTRRSSGWPPTRRTPSGSPSSSQGAVAIYNCANPPYHRWVQDWPPIANALLEAAERTGAVLATCSNLYGYHPDDAERVSRAGTGLTEDLPLTAPSTKGRVRARMWTDALDAHRRGGCGSPRCAPRTISAPRRRACSATWSSRVCWPARSARVLGDPDVPHAFTYVGDVARMLIVAAGDERAWGRAWHVPTHPARPVRQVIEEMAEVAAVPTVPVRRLPAWIQRSLALVMPVMREMPEVMYQHTRPWLLNSSAAQTTFGLAPTPWREILAAHLAQYRTAESQSAAA